MAFFASTILVCIAYRFVPVYFTPLMFIRCAQQLSSGESLTLRHHWVPLEEMSPSLPVAVMASEDQRFLQHHGFDYKAIEQAARRNREHPEKRKLGASTISQQTAKNAFLPHSRSMFRKGIEAYYTLLIERFWGKKRIMEVYLNSIEMGKGIYGAESVANENFNTTAKELSRRQCALIAASLPAPRKYNSAKPGPYLVKRSGQILRGMKFVDDFKMTSSNDEKK